MGELGETATVSGTVMTVIGSTPYQGAVMVDTEVEGRLTQLWISAADFDATTAVHGDPVIFRSLTYSIGRIERRDPGLVRIEIVR